MIEKLKFKSNQIISVEEDSKEIVDIARKRGIKVPSTHLGFFKTVYAKIEEPNLNGIRLAREAVEKGLPGLIGSQVNFEHLGAGFVMGNILDAWINAKDEIEVVYSFFKSIYPFEYERSVELAKEGKLSVSFELLSERETQESLADGTIRLHDTDFQGMGHLMDNPPAYPKAKVYEFAKLCKERLANAENRDLVYASAIEKACDDVLNSCPTDVNMIAEPPFTQTPEDAVIYIITTSEDGHFHVSKVDINGNGETVEVYGKDTMPHVHKIIDFQFQEADGHVHKILDELMAKIREDMKQAVKWQTSYTNTLPNSSFAVIEPGYLNDSTQDKKARHLPYKDKDGKIDLSHYRNALDKVNQIMPITDSISTEELRDKAQKELDKHKDILEANTNESNQGGNTNVEFTEEQKLKIQEIRVELGDFAKDISDADLLNDEVVVAIRQEVEKVKEANKSDLEKANEKITELEAKNTELVKTLEAKTSEVELVRVNAEKIGQLKIQLKDNEFVKDFTNEDYLNDEKVNKAIQDKTDADLVAQRKEALKDNEYAKDFKDEDYLNDDKIELAKVKKEKDELEASKSKETVTATIKKEEEMATGDTTPKTDAFETVMASVREQKNKNKETPKIYKRK